MVCVAEPKYGRVFTEEDVRRLLFSFQAQAADVEQALREFDGTFPADESVFVLRAKDDIATAGLWGYHEACLDMAGPGYIASVREAIQAFDRFREDHPDRMRVPD